MAARKTRLHRVLVTGSREWTDEATVWRILDLKRVKHGHILVVQGEAQGADLCSKRWAEARREAFASFPAQWDDYHRAAGPMRNRQMLTEMGPDEVVAFHDDLDGASKGTKDMVTASRKAGLPVEVHTSNGLGGK